MGVDIVIVVLFSYSNFAKNDTECSTSVVEMDYN